MRVTLKIFSWSILFFLLISSLSCNTDEEIVEPFDINLLYGKWQESGRNGIASLNDNFYTFRNTFTFEQCLEGGCWDGIWEWIVNDNTSRIKFIYSEPTGGWWQEFEITHLDAEKMEVIVFDYVEGKEDPVGSGIVMDFTKLDQ